MPQSILPPSTAGFLAAAPVGMEWYGMARVQISSRLDHRCQCNAVLHSPCFLTWWVAPGAWLPSLAELAHARPTGLLSSRLYRGCGRAGWVRRVWVGCGSGFGLAELEPLRAGPTGRAARGRGAGADGGEHVVRGVHVQGSPSRSSGGRNPAARLHTVCHRRSTTVPSTARGMCPNPNQGHTHSSSSSCSRGG